MDANWGNKIKVTVYVEGAEIDSAHVIHAARQASDSLKQLGYKVDHTEASLYPVEYQPKNTS